jgi:hypothetical protein
MSGTFFIGFQQRKMKQTAIEWLVETVEKNRHKPIKELFVYIRQAKEMEKENTINFAIKYMFGRTDIGSNLRNDFIQKYNETFKSE